MNAVRKRIISFLSGFPIYVCPHPALVNRSFLVQNGAIEMRFPTSDGAFHLLELVLGGFIDVIQLLKQTIKKKNRGPPTFFQLLSWLSRACLDKSSSITTKRACKKKERKKERAAWFLLLTCADLGSTTVFASSGAISIEICSLQGKNSSLFECFPYVCPEPVLGT
jgi:hypothetical protein